MIPVRKDTAFAIIVGPVLDASGVAVTDGVIGDFKISRPGTSAGAFNGSATAAHLHTGNYLITGTAADIPTVGPVKITVDDTVNAMAAVDLFVYPQTTYDALYAGTAGEYLGADVREFGGIAGQFISGYPRVLLTDGTGSGRVLLSLGVLQANLVEILGSDLAESVVGRIAAAISTWGNVATPVSTAASVNQSRDMFLVVGTGGEYLTALAPAATALSNLVWTDARAGLLEYLDRYISSRLSGTASIAVTLDPTEIRAAIGMGTSDLDDQLAAILAAFGSVPADVWQDLLNSGDFSVPNSAGERFVSWLDAAVSSRMSGTATISATVDLSAVLAAIADIPEDVWSHLLTGTAFSTSNSVGERIVAYLDRAISSRLSGTATLSASVGTAGLWDDLDRWYQEHKSGTGDLARVWFLGEEPVIVSHVTDQVVPDPLLFTIDGGSGIYLTVSVGETRIRLTDASTGVVETRVVSATGNSGGDILVYVNEGFSFTPAVGDLAEVFSDHVHDTTSLADAIWDEPMAGHVLANTSGAYLNTLITNVAALLVRIPLALFSGITSLRGWLRLMIRSDAFVTTQEADSLTEINSGTGTYDNTVASLQALGGVPGILDRLAGTADAIREQTDQLVFTTPGKVDATADVSVTLGTDDITTISDSIIAAIDASGVLVNGLTADAAAAIRAAVAGAVVYPSLPRDRTGQRITLYLGDRYGTGGRELAWNYAATAVPWMVAGDVRLVVRDHSGENQAEFSGTASAVSSGGVDYMRVSFEASASDWGSLTDGEGEFWVQQAFGEEAGTATMTAEHGTAVIIDDTNP